jgi:hypothetical protein
MTKKKNYEKYYVTLSNLIKYMELVYRHPIYDNDDKWKKKLLWYN